MDYFEMAADLPRDSYCMRQTQGEHCMSRTQCVMCELYQNELTMMPPHYPLPAIPLDYSWHFTINISQLWLMRVFRRTAGGFAYSGKMIARWDMPKEHPQYLTREDYNG